MKNIVVVSRAGNNRSRRARENDRLHTWERPMHPIYFERNFNERRDGDRYRARSRPRRWVLPECHSICAPAGADPPGGCVPRNIPGGRPATNPISWSLARFVPTQTPSQCDLIGRRSLTVRDSTADPVSNAIPVALRQRAGVVTIARSLSHRSDAVDR